MSKRLQFALSLPELAVSPGSETDRVVLFGKGDGLYYRGDTGDEVGPLGPQDNRVPDPSTQADDRWLSTSGGELVYGPAPTGGGGGGGGPAIKMEYEGTWAPGSYSKQSLVSHNNTDWVSVVVTSDEPGATSAPQTAITGTDRMANDYWWSGSEHLVQEVTFSRGVHLAAVQVAAGSQSELDDQIHDVRVSGTFTFAVSSVAPGTTGAHRWVGGPGTAAVDVRESQRATIPLAAPVMLSAGTYWLWIGESREPVYTSIGTAGMAVFTDGVTAAGPVASVGDLTVSYNWEVAGDGALDLSIVEATTDWRALDEDGIDPVDTTGASMAWRAFDNTGRYRAGDVVKRYLSSPGAGLSDTMFVATHPVTAQHYAYDPPASTETCRVTIGAGYTTTISSAVWAQYGWAYGNGKLTADPHVSGAVLIRHLNSWAQRVHALVAIADAAYTPGWRIYVGGSGHPLTSGYWIGEAGVLNAEVDGVSTPIGAVLGGELIAGANATTTIELERIPASDGTPMITVTVSIPGVVYKSTTFENVGATVGLYAGVRAGVGGLVLTSLTVEPKDGAWRRLASLRLGDLTDIDNTLPLLGHVLTYDGTIWKAAAPAPTTAQITDSTATGRDVLTAADAPAARTAIGAGTSSFDGVYTSLSGRPTLGTAAAVDTGTGTDQVILGNDARLTNARTPTSHAASHASGGGDPVTLAQSQVTSLVSDLAGKAATAHTQAASTISDSTVTGRSVLTAADASAARTAIGAGTSSFSGTYAALTGTPSTFAPSAHVHAAADVTTGTFVTGRLGSGTADSTTYLRGDSTWVTAPAPVNMATTDTTQTITGAKTWNNDAIIGAAVATAGATTKHSYNFTLRSAYWDGGQSQFAAETISLQRRSTTPRDHEWYFGLQTTIAVGAGQVWDQNSASLKVYTGSSGAASPTALQLSRGTSDTGAYIRGVTSSNTGTPVWSVASTGALLTQSTVTGLGVYDGASAISANRVYSAANLVPIAGLSATGSPDATTYLRGDNTWSTLNAHVHAAADVTTGTMATARLGSGTANTTTYLRGDNTWTTVSASPPANMVSTDTTQTITGAKTFDLPVLMAEADLTTEFSDTTPSSPTAGLSLFARHRARRLLASIGPNGQDTAYQPGLFTNRIARWNAVNNVAGPSLDGLAVTNVVAPTAIPNATTNYFTSMVRSRFSSAATAGAAAGTRSTTAQWFLSNTANRGGFFFVCRFGLSTTLSTSRMFFGLSSTTGAPANTNPSTWLNSVGFSCDTTVTNMQFGTNGGSGTAALTDLGANFPTQTATTWFFEARLFAASGNAGAVNWSILRLNDGVFTQGTATTKLPTADTLLSAHAWHNNGATAAVVSTDQQSLYIETDN